MGVPEGKESEQGIKNVYEEIMAENFHNQENEKGTQVQKARVPVKIKLRHITIKIPKVKDKERI